MIEVNLTSENPVEIVDGKTLEFSYSVEWASTEKPFYMRYSRYLDYRCVFIVLLSYHVN